MAAQATLVKKGDPSGPPKWKEKVRMPSANTETPVDQGRTVRTSR